MTDQKYIIFGQYTFSDKQVFIGGADSDGIATLIANVGATLLTPSSDTQTWVSATALEIISYSTGLNYLTIRIFETVKLNHHELSTIRHSRNTNA